ncbi:MAG TPA: polysaccharide deacetylase family protein [Ktedonobacteraceae bacterium]|nr:polysaccharide deacetylase family protein [Ktedonobacteraceae bacterium]
MRKRLGVLLATLFYYSGLVKLSRWLMQDSQRRVIILNYHRASGGDLRRQLLYLRRHYRIMPMEEALAELYAPARKQERHDDRRTPLVLTFDDGYRDFYTHAFKLACQLQIPITVFLIPGYVESGRCFWWEEGDQLVADTQVDQVTLDGRTYHLAQANERSALSWAIDRRLRAAPSVRERETFLTCIYGMLAIPANQRVDAAKAAISRSLTWDEIRTMQQSGWVTFGAHSMNHPILAALTDPAELHYEIKACRTLLEQQLGCAVRTFAYPVGKPEDFGEDAVKVVQEAGYVCAVTTVYGYATVQSDPFRIERLLTDVSRHWLVLAAEISGIWSFFSPLWKRVVGV